MTNRAPQVLVCGDEASVGREAAERFVCAAVRSVAKREAFFVAIPGGRGPRAMLALLAQPGLRDAVPWGSVHVFFTDERCVPPYDPESNYHQAWDLLLSKVPIPEQNVHRFRTELGPEEAARDYEKELRAVMGDDPAFDLIVLGVGPDGHTASLFPGSPVLHEMSRLAAAVHVEKLDSYRLTLTLPAICSAESVLVVAAGPEKAEAIRDVLHGEPDPAVRPIRAVVQCAHSILWLIDESAAELLR